MYDAFCYKFAAQVKLSEKSLLSEKNIIVTCYRYRLYVIVICYMLYNSNMLYVIDVSYTSVSQLVGRQTFLILFQTIISYIIIINFYEKPTLLAV